MGALERLLEWVKRRPAPLPGFRQCPGCGYDFATGEGVRGCNYFDCPYLPEALKVFCPACNYNFLTGEGNPECQDLEGCEYAAEGRKRAENVRAWLRRQGEAV